MSLLVRILRHPFYLLSQLVMRVRILLFFYWGITFNNSLNIVVGACDTKYPGWITTEQFFFDITDKASWVKNFGSKKISKILAEDVFEHLTLPEIKRTLLYAGQYLEKGGSFRIAVPDGFHPSQYVIDLVKPGGLDEGADDHKVLLTIDVFKPLAKMYGYDLQAVEFFDKNGIFHSHGYTPVRGFISRSKANYKGRFTESSAEYKRFIESIPDSLKLQFIKNKITYTSLLVDLVKL